jgi:hypothetical protein
MELRMSGDLDDASRAARLLRWYPRAWRERYGEEFADHLGQEFADRPVDLGRSVNVAYKGLVARTGDIGLSNSSVNLRGQTRAALGTSLAFIALMVVVMLNLWSRAMLAWSGRQYHPVPVSATTGFLTIALGLLLALLAAVVLTVAFFVARQIFHGRVRRLVGPSVLAVSSGGYLLYAARRFPTMLAPYVDGTHGLRQLSLSNPGGSLANFAQVMWELTQSWVAPWGQGIPAGPSSIQNVIDDCVPLAMFAFGVALALLIRRVEFPQASERLVLSTVALLGTFTGVFFVAYIVWSAVGGPSHDEYFAPEAPWLGVVYLLLLALIPSLVIRSGFLAWRRQSSRGRNHIEIVGSKNELA